MKVGRVLVSVVLAVVLAAMLSMSIVACSPEEYADEREVRLTFSTDTLAFDTLFTTLGSTTHRLTVYNRTAHDVRLGSITIGGGRSSRFRLNVDGDTAIVARNVELLSGDSLFIFAQVTIDPNDQTQPFLVEDEIRFSNGQRVPLTAWGRNAVYHQPSVQDSTWYYAIDPAQWDHTRPHVILGSAALLDGNTLTLQAGEELYFGPDAMLVFDTNAGIIVNGTAEQPVRFSSVRHDGWYSFLPGQWQCLLFTGGSTNSRIDYALFENGTGGLRVYPRAELHISNSVIRNMSDCALIGQGGRMKGENLLVYDCFSAFTSLRGGDYAFEQCTFADYWGYSSRQLAAVNLSNYLLLSEGTQAQDLTARFEQCIIYGSYFPAEIAFQSDSLHRFEVQLNDCHIKGVDEAADPRFVDVQNDDYHLQEDSPALGKGFLFNIEF